MKDGRASSALKLLGICCPNPATVAKKLSTLYSPGRPPVPLERHLMHLRYIAQYTNQADRSLLRDFPLLAAQQPLPASASASAGSGVVPLYLPAAQLLLPLEDTFLALEEELQPAGLQFMDREVRIPVLWTSSLQGLGMRGGYV